MNTVEISLKFVEKNMHSQIWNLKTKIYKINTQDWFEGLIYKTQNAIEHRFTLVIFKR